MGIADVNPKLASNRLVFDIRRSRDLMAAFHQNMEKVLAEYGLTQEEKTAWREMNIHALGELGVHPYFLPQISRIFRGAAYNHNKSEAARLYARTMVDRDP